MIASILGVGTSLFGKQPNLHPSALAWRAVAEALDDAGRPTIDAVYLGTVFGAPGVAQRALHSLGITGVPILTVDARERESVKTTLLTLVDHLLSIVG